MSWSGREVAENVAYRFEDQRYSVANEDGDHEYTSHEVTLRVYPIISYTKCGYWIGMEYSYFPRQPRPWREPTGLATLVVHNTPLFQKRFVNLQANKKFALPTIPAALESYLARKKRQISIYSARIKGAEAHIEAAQSFYNYKVPKGYKI